MKILQRLLVFGTLLLILHVVSSCIPTVGEQITVQSRSVKTGRIYYITARYTNMGVPVSGVQLRFKYQSGGVWHDLQDAITGQSVFTTDQNGEVSIGVLALSGELVPIKVEKVGDPEVHGEGSLSISKPSWAVLLFFVADNNLEDFAWADYNEAQTTNPDVSIISVLDTTNYGDYVMVLDEHGEWQSAQLDVEGDINTGDPEWLERAVEFLYSFDSKYKGLILWDHGSAWMYDSQVMVSDEQPDLIGYDETSGDGLAIAEVREALESALSGEKLDLLGMDACLMSSLEVAYELRNTAYYFLASAFSEPGEGWDYEFLNYINSYTTPSELGRSVVDMYFDYYTSPDSFISLALWNMNGMDDVANAVSNLGSVLSLKMSDSLADRILEYNEYDSTHYGDGDFYSLVDIYDFAEALYYNENDSQIRSAAHNVMNSVNSALVYGRMSHGLGSKGLSVFFPTTADAWNDSINDLQTLEFYMGSTDGWGNFLYDFLSELIH